MNAVWITNAATVTGLSPNLEMLWQRLMNGETAVAPVSRFSADRYITGIGAAVEGLEGNCRHSLLYPLLEMLLQDFGPVPPDCRLITATTKGCIDTLERLQRDLPADPAELDTRRLIDWVAARVGLRQGGVNINAACASSTIAVARGAALISSGMADAVLVVCMDLLSEFVFSGFSALQALSPTPCRPFDRGRNGLSLGEGGAALLLMNAGRARREKRTCLGTIVGWGAANDATHITAPARDGCGLIQTIRQALKTAELEPEAIGGINAHGTGTVYNDLMELTAFRGVFGDRPLPIHSVKGAIGHTLGAAGGIEVAVGLKSLEKMVIPPTTGFEEPEEGAADRVSRRSQPLGSPYLLSTNSGFGGVNAALILKGGTP